MAHRSARALPNLHEMLIGPLPIRIITPTTLSSPSPLPPSMTPLSGIQLTRSMEPGRQLRLIPLASFLFLLFVNSTNALCVPRNSSVASSPKASPTQPPPTQQIQPLVLKIPNFAYKSPAAGDTPSTASQETPSSPAAATSPPGTSGGGSPLETLLGAAAKAICAKTDYPDVCENSLHPYKTSVGSITAKSVTGMLIRACTNHTNTANQRAAQIVADASVEKSVKSYVELCKDSYADALDNLDEAVAALASGDKATLNIMVSAAMTDFESCEDGFDEIGATSPLSDIDGKLKQIASNILAVASSIHS